MRSLSDFRCGDIAVCYLQDSASGRVEMQLVPLSLMKLRRRIKRRQHLEGAMEVDGLPSFWKPVSAYFADSLIHFKVIGDSYSPGFAGGLTMRHSASVDTLKFQGQQHTASSAGTRIVTRFQTARGLNFDHVVDWRKGEASITVHTRCENEGTEPVTLELLSSFSLGGLTPFDSHDANGKLIIHRFRSSWSAEGRLESRAVEDLHLERSWLGHSQLCERFGQVGSMPVRLFFPFAAVEDIDAGVVWGAQLSIPGSWQMELYRRGDTLCLAGGLADREFGHWMKRLGPGEQFVTPPATLTVVQGDVEDACQRLVAAQKRSVPLLPKLERELPIVFNEWCASWGKPSHEHLMEIADRLEGTRVKYLVIDSGWSKGENFASLPMGDWEVDLKKFPQGLAATCAAIRQRGLIPGLWFEFEVCTVGSRAFAQDEHLLRRDGTVLNVGGRKFWDFRDPWVHGYLYEKVIRLLRENNIGYLKVDYNETLGLGCDGAESLGEGLRQHLVGVQSFFRKIREELPGLVIENCSSGGHRLEPSMQSLAAMGSFSDAHETVEIPLIAANLHSLILPQQSQIWAVLHPENELRRIRYSLAATFLGRMALSGDIHGLNPAQWKVVLESLDYYHAVYPIIRDGVSRRFGPPQKSFRHPRGWQAIVRATETQVLVVAHSFLACPLKKEVLVPLPPGPWKIQDHFGDGNYRIRRGQLTIVFPNTFTGHVVRLKKAGPARRKSKSRKGKNLSR
jgi:alpha-galactosidase